MDVKEIRKLTGLSQEAFAKKYGIPINTIHNWEQEVRKPPEYVVKLLERCVLEDIEEES